MIGNQRHDHYDQPFRDKNHDSSVSQAGRVVDTIPELITKKWLRAHYKICSTNVRGLYRLVLTVEVCEAIGLSQDEVREKRFRTFSAQHSRKLVKILFE